VLEGQGADFYLIIDILQINHAQQQHGFVYGLFLFLLGKLLLIECSFLFVS